MSVLLRKIAKSASEDAYDRLDKKLRENFTKQNVVYSDKTIAEILFDKSFVFSDQASILTAPTVAKSMFKINKNNCLL
jgi:hypothetical protein